MFSYLFFSLFFLLPPVESVSSLTISTPTPLLSLRSHSSLGPQKVHPPSFLSLLPSLRSQKNSWLSGMHFPPPHCRTPLICLLTVCLCLLACPSSREKQTIKLKDSDAGLSISPLCLSALWGQNLSGKDHESASTLVRVTHIFCNVSGCVFSSYVRYLIHYLLLFPPLRSFPALLLSLRHRL